MAAARLLRRHAPRRNRHAWSRSSGLMLPPDPGSWAHARTIRHGAARDRRHRLPGHAVGGRSWPCRWPCWPRATSPPSASCASSSRRSLDTIRSVDILVWALIWINVVGLGPFAGALAIMTSDIGTFGKLFSEAIEAADRKPVEGIVSTGGSQAARHPLRHPARGLSRAGEPGALLSSNRTRARPPSSASSAPAASACISPKRSAPSNCSRPRSSSS